MKKIFLILTLLTLIAVIAVCNNSNEEKSALTSGNKFEKIDSVIVHAINDSTFPGAVVLVSKDWDDVVSAFLEPLERLHPRVRVLL